MKAMVCVKQVVDHKVKIRVRPDLSGVDIRDARRSINPFDEIAVEEAVRLKKQGIVSDILAVSVCDAAHADVLRTAMAMGADRALHIEAPQGLEPLIVAKALAAVAGRESPELLLLGKQAIDDDCNQTGQMLAALLNISQATNASSITVEENRLRVVREIDGGLETVSLSVPAVITADLRLNTPGHISLPNMMKAKKKPIAQIAIESLNIPLVSKITLLRVREPTPRPAGITVPDIDTLIHKLRHEAKVL